MSPERFRRLEELFHTALDRPPDARAAYLAEACGGDESLRREAESMLAGASGSAGLLDKALPDAAGSLIGSATITAITPGLLLGPYRIEARLGSGGMGDVFAAVDTRLGRRVAIKTFKQQINERFEREARAISALNHPHVCILYDVGPNYLVMELVEGETLAERIQRGKLTTEETAICGAQIADALAAAHARGIIHRDLKPGNIMLARTGVKVLDFGLAKSKVDPELTASGVVMGTPAYMAPEQRNGTVCDARTDIYALGLVLREMATGRRDPGSWNDAHPALSLAITRCLDPDPNLRWESAADVAAILRWKPASPAAPAAPRPPGRIWIPVALALLFVMALLLGWRILQSSAPPGISASFTETADGQADSGNTFEVSPNGRFLAASLARASGERQIWVRPVSELQGIWLDGTIGATAVFWSADSQWIAFFASGRIRRVRPAGGPTESVADAPGLYCGAWNADGDIVFAPTNRSDLYRIRASGGAPEILTKLDTSRGENSHRWPRFLPGGRRFVFTARATEGKNNAVYLGSLDSRPPVLLTYVESQAVPVPGALLFVREQTLFRQPFDGQRLTGPSVAVRGGVAQNAISVVGGFSASLDGRVTVIRPAISVDTRLLWFTRRGEPAASAMPDGVYNDLRISPDGATAVVDRPDGNRGNRDLWSIDLHSGSLTRLTTNPANDMMPLWLQGGREIVFASDRGGTPAFNFFRKPAFAADGERKLEVAFPSEQFDMTDITADGRWGFFFRHNPPFSGMVVERLDGRSPAISVNNSGPGVSLGRFSPKGNWLSYSSRISGRDEVYVQRFQSENGATEGPAMQVSRAGGSYSSWSRDGGELFFLSPDWRIFSVRTADLDAGSPTPAALFRLCGDRNPLSGTYAGYAYDPAPDGRFLAICDKNQKTIFEFSVKPPR